MPGLPDAPSTEDLMWLLGLYIGDGNLHLSTKTYRGAVRHSATDVELRTELTRVVRSVRTAVHRGRRLPGCGELHGVDRGIVALGFDRTLIDQTRPGLGLPTPVDQRLAFCGWVDADGYVQPERSGSVMLTSANEPLIRQARELAELSGLRAAGPWPFTQPIATRLSACRPHGGWASPASSRSWAVIRNVPSGSAAVVMSTSSSASHGTTIRPHCNDWLGFERVNSIEPFAVEPVFDIEVDGPHNFVAEGLVAHNSEVVYHQIREDLEAQGLSSSIPIPGCGNTRRSSSSTSAR